MKLLTTFGAKLGTLALATIFTVAFTVNASATLIDDFETDQTELVANTGMTVSSTVSGLGIIGGYRDITIAVPAAADTLDEPQARVRVSGGLLRIANDPGTVSLATIAWDGQGFGENAVGLGSAGNLDNSFGVLVQVIFADLSNSIEFELIDTLGHSAKSIKNLGAGPGLYLMPFASFVGDSVDTSSLFAIIMRVEGDSGLDINIDLVQSAVPEPSTMLLSAAALLALGFFRKRRA